jgi:tripartite-type tricarboxylate transporter receptor subunit TctC
LVAPPGTPAALAQRLNRDAVDVLRSKEVGDRLAAISLEVGATSPADTTRFFNEEAALWSGVIKQAGIEPR